MVAWLRTLPLILKKWNIHIQHPISLLLELSIPIFICSLLGVLGSIMSTDKFGKNVLESDNPLEDSSVLTLYKTIVFSPTNSEIQKLLTNAIDGLDMEIINLDNSKELEKYLLESDESDIIALKFDETLKNLDKLPKKLEVAVKFPLDKLGKNTLKTLRGILCKDSTLTRVYPVSEDQVLGFVKAIIITGHNKDHQPYQPNVLYNDIETAINRLMIFDI